MVINVLVKNFSSSCHRSGAQVLGCKLKIIFVSPLLQLPGFNSTGPPDHRLSCTVSRVPAFWTSLPVEAVCRFWFPSACRIPRTDSWLRPPPLCLKPVLGHLRSLKLSGCTLPRFPLPIPVASPCSAPLLPLPGPKDSAATFYNQHQLVNYSSF